MVAALSHFPELKGDLEFLGSRRNTDLTEDQADALWSLVNAASDSLALLIPSSLLVTLLTEWGSSGGSLCS
jgi:hypothetical protein